MIEENETENQTALLVDSHEAAVADPRHEVDQPRRELLHAAPLRGVGGRGLRIRPRLPRRRRRVGRLAAVLEPVLRSLL